MYNIVQIMQKVILKYGNNVDILFRPDLSGFITDWLSSNNIYEWKNIEELVYHLESE